MHRPQIPQKIIQYINEYEHIIRTHTHSTRVYKYRIPYIFFKIRSLSICVVHWYLYMSIIAIFVFNKLVYAYVFHTYRVREIEITNERAILRKRFSIIIPSTSFFIYVYTYYSFGVPDCQPSCSVLPAIYTQHSIHIYYVYNMIGNVCICYCMMFGSLWMFETHVWVSDDKLFLLFVCIIINIIPNPVHLVGVCQNAFPSHNTLAIQSVVDRLFRQNVVESPKHRRSGSFFEYYKYQTL